MATNGAPLPFFFVFLLFFSSFSLLSHCPTTAAARPAVSSARAAAIQYWNLKFPKSKPPPPFFLSKLSTLSPLQLATNFHNNRHDAPREGQGSSTSSGLGSPNNIKMVTSDAGSSKENQFFWYQTDGGVSPKSNNKDGATASSDAGSSKENQFFWYQNDGGVSPKSDNKDGATASSDAGSSKENQFFWYQNGGGVSPKSDNKDGATASSDAGSSKENQFFWYQNDGGVSPKSDNKDGASTASSDVGSSKENQFFWYQNDGDVSPKLDNKDGAIVSSDVGSSKENQFFWYQNDGGVSPKSDNKDGATASSDAGSSKENQFFFYQNDGGVSPKSDNKDGATASSDAGSSKENQFFFYQNDGGVSPKSDNKDGATASSDAGSSKENQFFWYQNDGGVSPKSDNKDGATAMNDAGRLDKSHSLYHGNRKTPINRNSTYDELTGIFFRESHLTNGTVMPLHFPGIKKMTRALHFLPRSVASEIPFSASAIKKIFRVSLADAATNKAVDSAIAHCKMPANIGEIKRCVASAEDMMDFVHESSGSDNVQVSGTTNFNGAGRNVLIGDVKAVNDGRFTEAISCHMLNLPLYLVHHCHNVPKTRVYEADILEIGTKEKINHATAICHIDTSTWSANHVALVALGSAPGKIEVCHWISSQDMAWIAVAHE